MKVKGGTQGQKARILDGSIMLSPVTLVSLSVLLCVPSPSVSPPTSALRRHILLLPPLLIAVVTKLLEHIGGVHLLLEVVGLCSSLCSSDWS